MERRRTVWLLLMALAIPLLGPVIARFILRKGEANKPEVIRIVSGMLALHLVLLAYFGVAAIRDAYAFNQFKRNVHLIYNAIANWQVDRNDMSVPDHLTDLVREGYMSQLPVNPFTGKPIHEVALNGEARPGDVTYLPVYNLTPNEYAYPSSFGLIGYGPSRYEGISNDYAEFPAHVVIALDAGLDLRGFDTDGDGINDTKHCKGGLSCRDVIKVYRGARNKGDRIRGWVTLSEYRQLKGKQQEAGTTP